MKKIIVIVILFTAVGGLNPTNSNGQVTATCPSGDTTVCLKGEWGTVYKGDGRVIIRPSNFLE